MSTLTAEDKIEIKEILYSWGFIHDNRRFDLMDMVFTPDVVFDLKYIGMADELQDFEGYVRLLRGLMDRGVIADHHTMSSVIVQDEDGNARARSRYITRWEDGRVYNGEYLDVLRRTPAGWRISLRKMARRLPRPDAGMPPEDFYRGWPFA